MMSKIEANRHPLISVLMAVYNTAGFLSQAIESVLDETYSNFELLLYDDMSTDDSTRIMAEYAGKDFRIRLYRGDRKAPSIAYIFKFLISQSKGEYFTIIGSDDICLPGRLQRLVKKAVKNPSASIVFGWHRMVNEKCTKTLQIFGEPIWPFKYFLGGFVHTGASLISKKHYTMTDGFNEEILWSADRDLYLKMLECGPFVYIRKVVYLYRRHMASWTFRRPDDYDALSIIREKTARRNIPIVRRYLRKGKGDITYHEYIALNYVIAFFFCGFFGANEGDRFVNYILYRLTKELGVTYRNFLNLKHNIDLTNITNINQLHSLITGKIERIMEEPVTLLLQFYYNKRPAILREVKKLSIFINKNKNA
jgi:glycosyltransferase involved in cell wall biosynthesis